MEKKPIKKMHESMVLSITDLHKTLPKAIDMLKAKHKDGVILTCQTAENVMSDQITIICEVFINE